MTSLYLYSGIIFNIALLGTPIYFTLEDYFGYGIVNLEEIFITLLSSTVAILSLYNLPKIVKYFKSQKDNTLSNNDVLDDIQEVKEAKFRFIKPLTIINLIFGLVILFLTIMGLYNNQDLIVFQREYFFVLSINGFFIVFSVVKMVFYSLMIRIAFK